MHAADDSTALPERPLPQDWSPRRLLLWAVSGQLLLLPVGAGHLFVWGGRFAAVLNLVAAAGLALATLVSGVALARCVRQAGSLDLRFLFRGGALLALLAFLVPPFLSSDVFDYVARGRVEVLGHNPYVTSVADLRGDPGMLDYPERARWPAWVMPYGPVQALLQRLCALLPSAWLAAYLWKALTTLAHFCASWLLFRAMLRTLNERDARRGLVLWLWNPWLLLELCGAGHNDALSNLLLAAMVAGLATGRIGVATTGYGFALLVKHGSALFGPLLLAHALWHGRLRSFLAGTAIVLAAVLGSWWIYFRAPGSLDFLWRQADVAHTSVASFLAAAVDPLAGQVFMVLALLASLALLLIGCRRARDAGAFGGWGILAGVAFIAGLPNFAPWYHLWWLPLFALCSAPVLPRVVELLAWLGPFSYLVYVGTRSYGFGHRLWQFALAGAWPVLLLLLEARALVAGKRSDAA
jgi:hypothetical protein